jgi:hypothetical protein
MSITDELLEIQYFICSVFAPATTELIRQSIESGEAPDDKKLKEAGLIDSIRIILIDQLKDIAPEDRPAFFESLKLSIKNYNREGE